MQEHSQTAATGVLIVGLRVYCLDCIVSCIV